MSQAYNTYYPMVPFTFDEVRQGEGDYPQDGWNSDIFIGRFVLWIKNSEGDNSGVGKILRKTKDGFEFIGDIGTVSGNYNVSLSWKELL